MAAKIVSFMNQKGGVGKTTTTVNIGSILANEHGRRVLLVDLDPQGNLSDHVGLDPNQVEESVYNVIIDGLDPRIAIRRVHGFETLPANIDLSGAEIELAALEDRHTRLKNGLDRVRDQYDYILMDCPPSLGLLTVSGLAAADAVIITMEAEYMALRGISQILHTINLVEKSMNPGLEVSGVIFCRYDGRTTLAREVKAEVENHLTGKVYDTAIRRNIRLAEAPSRGLPINIYDASCAGTEDYRKVAAEFITRFEGVESVEVDLEVDVMGATAALVPSIDTPIVPEDDGRGGWQRQPRW